MQECFADIVGCRLVQNAGYNIEPFIERVQGFMKNFTEPEMLPYCLLAKKRSELLLKCFRKSSNDGILKERI